MKKVKEKKYEQYSLTEGAKKGISSVVKDAEKYGLTVLTKYNSPCAIVIPLSPLAYSKYLNLIKELVDVKIRAKDVPAEFESLAYFLRGLSQMQIDIFERYR